MVIHTDFLYVGHHTVLGIAYNNSECPKGISAHIMSMSVGVVYFRYCSPTDCQESLSRIGQSFFFIYEPKYGAE